MPPQIKITKEKILMAALEVVNESGYEGLNARNLALKLKSSVQPIYYQFSSIEELKSELIKYAYNEYSKYIYSDTVDEKMYLKTGMGYIKYAKEHPNLFKVLFMRRHPSRVEDPTLEYIYNIIMDKTGLAKEVVKEFHFRMWVYVHGIAAMVNTKLIDLKDEEIENLLVRQFNDLLGGYKNG